MKETIYALVTLLTGAMILGTGIHYRVKEKDNPESRKIYTIAAIVGAVIAIAAVVWRVVG